MTTPLSGSTASTLLNEERLVEFCQMAEAMGVHVQLRIKHTRFTYLIGNILDLGPTGVEVPQVEQESSVLEAVDNFHYPQQGVRSWGGSARWGLKDHPDPADYMAWWNSTGVLWIQIESIHAVGNARRLAKPGVDCLSWGPMDLSLTGSVTRPPVPDRRRLRALHAAPVGGHGCQTHVPQLHRRLAQQVHRHGRDHVAGNAQTLKRSGVRTRTPRLERPREND